MRYSEWFVQLADNESFQRRDARTFIGITEDKQHLLIAVAEGFPDLVDPRSLSGLRRDIRWLRYQISCGVFGLGRLSSGMTALDMFGYLQECNVDGRKIVSGYNLDGGGSSAMVVPIGDGYELHQVVDPTDGQARPIPNCLAFIPR
jgi:hypothetical protein